MRLQQYLLGANPGNSVDEFGMNHSLAKCIAIAAVKYVIGQIIPGDILRLNQSQHLGEEGCLSVIAIPRSSKVFQGKVLRKIGCLTLLRVPSPGILRRRPLLLREVLPFHLSILNGIEWQSGSLHS